jgi:hypothetical protein
MSGSLTRSSKSAPFPAARMAQPYKSHSLTRARGDTKAAATRRAPFQLWQKEKIRALVLGAGFKESLITLSCCIVRFPSAEAMITMMMAGTPLGVEMAGASPSLLAHVVGEVAAGLADYEDDHGLALPMQAWTIVARK